jgi:methionyl-tRNA formyltransferase
MKVAVIGRTEILYETAVVLKQRGYEVSCILSSKEAPEYTRTADDFRKLAEQWTIPYAQGSRIQEHIDFLRSSSADIAVSINYTGVIPQEVIDVFPLGVLNSHGGDLPRYRGNACQAWAIINGEKRVGLCIHKMIGGELDSGDIVARDYLAIDDTTKVTTVWNWMVMRTPGLMVDAVERLAEDPSYRIEVQSRNPADALRCYPRRPQDGRIVWGSRAIDVLRLVNASNRPYAGAFCELQGERMIVWDAALVEDDEVFLAVPGQVVAIGEGFIDVACGDGKIRLREIELGGKVSPPDLTVKSLRTRLE